MIGSSIPTFLNMQYRCCECERNLGDKYSGLKGQKQIDVNIIKGKQYCNKCADKHWND